MQFKTYLQSKLPLYLALSSLFVLASCGSYQYVGYDSDGIYNSSDEVPVAIEAEQISTTNSSYYKGYFAQKSEKYEKLAQDENVVFTDIDTYEGTYNEVTGQVEYDEGYAGWGQNANNVTINVYDNNWGWNNWGWGLGWNNWGWNAGWGYGWNNWGWGLGWNNWGWNNWGWGPGWNNWGWNAGFGWCAPYYGNYSYYGNSVAYQSTRRGSYASNLGRNNSQYTDRGNITRRNTTTRNSNGTRYNQSNNTRYNPANSVRSNSRSSTRFNGSSSRSTNSVRSNSRSNSNTRSTNTRSNTRINTPSRSTSRSSTRVNAPSRSSSGSSSTRSSGSSRSSSGSSGRSSGGSSRRGG